MWKQFIMSFFFLSSIFNGFTSGLSSYRKNYPVGVCGLSNLGNTCFMNSAIQCISNVAPLRDFVLSGNFHGYVNENNRLGSHGEIAYAFEALIKEMWSEQKRGSNCVPRDLKVSLFPFYSYSICTWFTFILDKDWSLCASISWFQSTRCTGINGFSLGFSPWRSK